MNSSNQRFKYARKFMHMQEIHSFFAYELKIYNSWNKAVVSKYFLVVFALSFISSFRVEQNYLVINYSLVFPLVFRFCAYKKIYTYIFRDFFNVILYSWGLKQLMIYQMNTFGFSSKGPFYTLLLCFFFFFLLHHLLFWSLKEQMDKFRLRALKEPHQKNCTTIRVDLIPCLLRLDDLNTCY